MTTKRVEIPPKLIPVFTQPARIRGAFGGRGSAKTRTFAKMTAIEAIRRSQAGERGVILCAREFMNSLDESSMMEVKEAILSEPWIASYFEIGERYIRTKDRRIEYKFAGLRHNIDSIKSKARILILWVDEAEPVSSTAWDKTLPTVREEGSEIWVTWNPEVEGSATDKTFRQNPPDDAIIVEMNYTDNPWFPEVLKKQMEWDRKRDPDKFAHIWDGGYNTRSETRVFHNWEQRFFTTDESEVERFYYGADWGFSIDPTVLVRGWIDEPARKLYIDHEVYQVGCEIDHTPALFAGDCPHPDDREMAWKNPKNYEGIPGAMQWPIIADSARPETISYMRKKGFDIKPSKKGPGSIMDGIEFLKNYDIVVHARCKHTADELRHYRWKTDPRTDEILPVPEDKKNHVIDALRYSVELVRRFDSAPLDMSGGRQDNWARVF